MLKLIRSCQRVPQFKIDKLIQMAKDFFFSTEPPTTVLLCGGMLKNKF